MTRRGRQRLLQTIAFCVVVAAGIVFYLRVTRPDRSLLVRFATERLEEIFGPGVEHQGFEIDLLSGVEIRGLRVVPPGGGKPTLEAERVVVEHDLVALASGRYVPTSIRIDGARIVTHETPTGIAPDFPFTLERGGSDTPVPEVRVRRSRLLYRAMEDSERLRPARVIELADVEVDIVPEGEGRLRIRGGFRPLRLGQDDVRVFLHGEADTRADTLSLVGVWNPLRVTEGLLDALAEPWAERLRDRGVESLELVVWLEHSPDVGSGELRVRAGIRGDIPMDIDAIPGTERIDARTREQLRALLGRGDLDLMVSEEGFDIRGLATAMAGGDVNVQGSVESGGEAFQLVIEIDDLRLDDPALQQALGEEGAAIFAAFDPSGVVDAVITLDKQRDRELDWRVDALLEDASFRYVGEPAPDGSPMGFPYRLEHASGSLRIVPGEVRLDDIVGFNVRSGATVTIRGHRSTSWTGGETGIIRFGHADGGAEVHLTVEAANVPVDDELAVAVEGSEFAGLLETFRVSGMLDRIEVDIERLSGVDEAAVAEVRVLLDGVGFTYDPFPLPLDRVRGWFTLRRPLEDGQRGRVFSFDVHGRTEGAPVHASAVFEPDAGGGRLHVRGEGVPLAGDVTAAILSAEGLDEGLHEAWRYLDPRGRADVVVDMPIDDDPDPIRVTTLLDGASFRLDAAEAVHPLEVTDVHGRIEAVGDVLTLDAIEGRIGASEVTIDGKMDGGTHGAWDLHVTTAVLRLSPELLESLRELLDEDHLLPDGFTLEPGGRLALDMWLRRPTGGSELEATVHTTDIRARMRVPLGMTLDVVGKRLEVDGDRVEFEGVRASAGGVRVVADKAVFQAGDLTGRFRMSLDEVAASRALLDLLPDDARETAEEWTKDRLLVAPDLLVDLREDGSAVVHGALTLLAVEDAPASEAPRGPMFFDHVTLSRRDAGGARTLRGTLRFEGFNVGLLPIEELVGEAEIRWLRLGDEPEGEAFLRARRARIADLQVRDVHVPVVWREGILAARPITGVVAGGQLRGYLLVHTRAPEAYEGEAHLEGFELAMLRNDLAPTGPEVRGRGRAHIRFQNPGTDAEDLVASGTMTIREGHLGDLPVVASVFVLIDEITGGDNPPHFERADLAFDLADEVISFRQLDLAGPLFHMPGFGTLDLSGHADLHFSPDFIKSLLLPGSTQLPVLGPVLEGLLQEDYLYAIRIQGDIETAEPEVVLLPRLDLGRADPFEGTGSPELPRRRVPRWFR